MPKKISEQKEKEAQELRLSGKSYDEIASALSLSISWCRHNLINIEKGKQAVNYIVYIAHDGSTPVYVGEGFEQRHKHVNSGCSHVYQLNKDHFDGVVYEIEIIKLSSKQEAEELESIFIEMLKPKYNKRLPITNETRTKAN